MGARNVPLQKKLPNPQDGAISLVSHDLQHHDALQFTSIDARAFGCVFDVPNLAALSIPRGDGGIGEQSDVISIPISQHRLCGQSFIHVGELAGAVRLEEVPQQFGALDVLVAPHAEPVVAASAHPVMVKFLSAGCAVEAKKFDG